MKFQCFKFHNFQIYLFTQESQPKTYSLLKCDSDFDSPDLVFGVALINKNKSKCDSSDSHSILCICLLVGCHIHHDDSRSSALVLFTFTVTRTLNQPFNQAPKEPFNQPIIHLTFQSSFQFPLNCACSTRFEP